MPVLECGTVWSPLAEGPFFNGTLVPRIQLAILNTSKIMSWPRLARPRDLVGSLVWRGDDRTTEIFFLFTLERNADAHGPSRARVSVFECGTVWSPLAEGPFFNGTLVPRIQLAILTTSKSMSWPRLARPRDLVDSLVWRGDNRATEIFSPRATEENADVHSESNVTGRRGS